MKRYKIEWLVPDSPNIEFDSDELNNDSYDFDENEYSYDSFDVTIATNEKSDWLDTLNASGTINIIDMNMGFDTLGYTITYNTVSTLIVGDVLLIDNEYFDVNGITHVNNYYYATLGRITDGSTINTSHYATATSSITAYINGRFTPIGTIGKLYDEDYNIVKHCVIESIITNGFSIVITVGSIINNFDKEFHLKFSKYSTNNKIEMSYILPLIFGDLVTFQDGFWDALNFFELIQRLPTDNDGRSTIINPWTVLKELIKLRNGYIQIKNGVYHVNFINLLTEFDGSIPTMSIYDYISLDGGYSNSLSGTSTNVIYKSKSNLKENPDDDDSPYIENEITLESTVGYNSNQGEITEVEIDLVEYVFDTSAEGREGLLRKIASIRGLVFGYLTIMVVPTHTYEIGDKYLIDEIENNNTKDFTYFIPNVINVIALCYSANNNEVKFLLIEKIVKYPISPSMYMIATNNNTLELLPNANIGDYIYGDREDLTDIRNPDFNYEYFTSNDGDLQIMNNTDYTLFSYATLIGDSSNIYTLNISTLIVGDVYIVEYSKLGGKNYLTKHLQIAGGII